MNFRLLLLFLSFIYSGEIFAQVNSEFKVEEFVIRVEKDELTVTSKNLKQKRIHHFSEVLKSSVSHLVNVEKGRKDGYCIALTGRRQGSDKIETAIFASLDMQNAPGMMLLPISDELSKVISVGVEVGKQEDSIMIFITGLTSTRNVSTWIYTLDCATLATYNHKDLNPKVFGVHKIAKGTLPFELPIE